MVKGKIIIGALALSVFSGSVGVYAGTVIDSYKTNRGNIATVENEEVHKNHIGITVNGKQISQDTWYANGVTYAPIRDVANMLGASIIYDKTKNNADMVTESKVLDLLGIKIGETYYGKHDGRDVSFKITSFNPVNGDFENRNFDSQNITGKLTTSNLVIDDIFNSSTWYPNVTYSYNGAEKKFQGKYGYISLKNS